MVGYFGVSAIHQTLDMDYSAYVIFLHTYTHGGPQSIVSSEECGCASILVQLDQMKVTAMSAQVLACKN